MTCQHCQAQTPTGVTLCKRCVARLEDVLSQIEDALEMAEDTIAKQSSSGAVGAAMAGVAESEAPINLTASERRTKLWETIVSYARLVLEHDDSDDLAGVEPVVYLSMSTDLIARQDFAGKLLDDLEHHHRRVMQTIDTAGTVLLGQCGIEHQGHPCPGQLRSRKGDHHVRCKTCGSTHDVEAKASEAWDQYAPLSAVVALLQAYGHDINHRSAKRWAQQGELIGKYQGGVAVYSSAQVLDTQQRMKARHGGRRSKAA